MSLSALRSPADRLAEVRQRISAAATASGRDPAEITTIIVTKFHPVSLVRELIALGAHDFGENRHQEAQQKARELAGEPVTWHFVGQLQSKKARQVAGYAHVIHSIDRDSVVKSLAGGAGADGVDAVARPVTDCFVQVNLTTDPRRGGVAPESLEPLVEKVLTTDCLRLLGVMAVAPADGEPARAFAEVRTYSERVLAMAPEARFISAGMSHDFESAIAHGATHLRIGSAITGNRPEHG
ncbi:YggS family pyridoxal phosphate-dependent enzyme [Homoserinimonas sp. OAct 916]|uniref:YggS family pyridoxal phosphate-dependent enzyme n=1 Tax=Homoserinimonas sp. OAct 916 TaxID=2211450 RepID=UPI000DBE91AD|nr:YggS family pyridoxal phosphate-dependent enzyme [Homoserinimonas sp. OAct 916]